MITITDYDYPNPATGSYTQDKINILSGDIVWIDTLLTSKPSGLNRKRYEDVIKRSKTDEAGPFVVPFSKTVRFKTKSHTKRKAE